MKEIEVKILEVKRVLCVEKLLNLGAKKIFEGELIAYHFDKDKELNNANKKLRLRQEGNKVVLCLKEPISFHTVKVMEETEVEVNDMVTTIKILEHLGYKKKRGTSKIRISYKLDGVRFDFDKYLGEYDFVPEFLEIEASSQELIMKYVALLGFKENQLKPWTTGDLIKYYKK